MCRVFVCTNLFRVMSYVLHGANTCFKQNAMILYACQACHHTPGLLCVIEVSGSYPAPRNTAHSIYPLAGADRSCAVFFCTFLFRVIHYVLLSVNTCIELNVMIHYARQTTRTHVSGLLNIIEVSGSYPAPRNTAHSIRPCRSR